MIKSSLKKFFEYVKKNFFACACFLLAGLVALTGSFSYSKYISSDPVNDASGAGSFTASANIDGVSALSFTNTAFWGGTVDDDRIAMNALRTINFSVNNYNVVDGVEKVAEVKLQYSLSFSTPTNFAERLAIQLFDSDDKVMLPQVVLNDLILAATHKHVFQTATSDDFNSVYHHDLTFETSKVGNNYTAVFDGSIHDEPVKVVIKLEEYMRSTHQLLHFRTWDTSGITSAEKPTVNEEGGKLTPPLQVKFTRTIPFYRITISMSNMVLPAGEKATKKHSIRLAPTDTLKDDHLAGYFVEKVGDEYLPVTSLYGPNNEGEVVNYELQTVKEVSFDEYYTDARAFTEADKTPYQKKNNYGEHHVVEHDENLVGSVHYYTIGETGYFENNASTTFVELGSFAHEDRRFIDDSYVYLMRTVSGSNVQWTLLDEVPTWDGTANKYYRLHVKFGEIITRAELKLTKGNLKSEIEEIKAFEVSDVQINADGTHDDVTFNITSTNLLRYTLLENASGTYTVSQILDIEEEGLVYEVLKGNKNWGSTSETIHEPNLTIKPYVTTTNYTNASNEVVIEQQGTEYIIKKLSRDISRVNVEVEDVRTTIINSEGEPQEIVYTQTNPLNLIGDDNLQKVYLSQCYSKNYPFYVNVVFEQVQ